MPKATTASSKLYYIVIKEKTIYTYYHKTKKENRCTVIEENRSQVLLIPKDFSLNSLPTIAIIYTIDNYEFKQHIKYTIVTNSSSTLKQILNPFVTNTLIIEIQHKIKLLREKQINIRIDCTENTIEDLNETNRKKIYLENLQLPMEDAKLVLHKKLREKWNDEWQKSKRNALHECRENIYFKVPTKELSRREQIFISRIRIGHTRLTHGYLMEKKNPPHAQPARQNSQLNT